MRLMSVSVRADLDVVFVRLRESQVLVDSDLYALDQLIARKDRSPRPNATRRLVRRVLQFLLDKQLLRAERLDDDVDTAPLQFLDVDERRVGVHHRQLVLEPVVLCAVKSVVGDVVGCPIEVTDSVAGTQAQFVHFSGADEILGE